MAYGMGSNVAYGIGAQYGIGDWRAIWLRGL
jgi:hypothetical protein